MRAKHKFYCFARIIFLTISIYYFMDIRSLLNTWFPQFEDGLKNIIAENATLKEVKAGELIMRSGQYFHSTMLVVKGRIKIYREGEDGNEFFMYYLDAGNSCALSMICAAKNETSQILAKAIDDSVLIAVPLKLMDELMTQYKSWYYFVLETYRSRFEELLIVIDNIVFKAMDERLEFYLKNEVEKKNSNRIEITHQDIANDLNSSREVISRLLKKMEQQHKVTLHRNYIEVIQL